MSMIQPVSGLVSSAVQSPAAAGVKGTPEVRRPEAEAPVRAQTPRMDEYVPEEKQEPSGRYWLGKDEDGQPKVYFDHPEKPDEPDAPAPVKKANENKAESCTGNTDQVDREIENLKKKRDELERQISAETDDAKVKELEQQLAQVERELSQKDNDTYRRQHTVFS